MFSTEKQKSRQHNCCRDKISRFCGATLHWYDIAVAPSLRLPTQSGFLREHYVLGYLFPFASALGGPYYRVRFLPTSHRRRLSLSPFPVFFPSTVYWFDIILSPQFLTVNGISRIFLRFYSATVLICTSLHLNRPRLRQSTYAYKLYCFLYCFLIAILFCQFCVFQFRAQSQNASCGRLIAKLYFPHWIGLILFHFFYWLLCCIYLLHKFIIVYCQ